MKFLSSEEIEEVAQMTCYVIEANQGNLENLDLSYNNFSHTDTQNIMTAISDSVARNSILKLNFDSSANFDQIESREKLAFLLATSAKLTECNIENQTGTSKASVLIKYAKGIGKGMG